MEDKIVISSDPRYGYFYDLNIRNLDRQVPTVPELGCMRTSVFDEIKIPAYK